MTEEQRTILVVDDEETVRNLLQRVLKEAGYDVITVASGHKALDKVSQCDVSLVLLDIIMPELDGYQTLELIRQRSNVPVVMVTAVLSPISVQQSLGLGADDYIRKPFKRGELLARIQAKLRRAETAS